MALNWNVTWVYDKLHISNYHLSCCKITWREGGIRTAILAALIGALIFALVSYLIGIGWVAALAGGLAWLIALRSLYNISLLKSFVIAVVIWIFCDNCQPYAATISGLFKKTEVD